MNAIKHAIQLGGGPTAVARVLGKTKQAVCFYRDGERQFPEGDGPALELHVGGAVPVEALCPDAPWIRVPDPEWPHPEGRPCLDVAKREPGST